MKHWRAHRFTPLGDLPDSEARRSGVPGYRASLAEGFQQGMACGYRDGQESGLREGREQGLAQGLEEGRALGREHARQEVREHFETLAAPLQSMFESLTQLQSDYQAALRKEVVELVAKVARQVIRCELALQPAQLLALVDETLSTMPSVPDGSIEVYLNETDLQRILEIDHSHAASWKLLPDARLEPGECRVRAGSHEADAGCRQRLDRCMEQISTQLLPQSADREQASDDSDAVTRAGTARDGDADVQNGATQDVGQGAGQDVTQGVDQDVVQDVAQDAENCDAGARGSATKGGARKAAAGRGAKRAATAPIEDAA